MATGEDLGREIAELAARLDAATHRLLECIRQFDESQEWGGQGALSCAHWLSWRIGLDPATAREKVRVARALGALPAIDAALAAGKLSYAKVRAMTRVATPANEQRLLELGLSATGAQLERICRGYRAAATVDDPIQPEERYVTRRQLAGGMVKIERVLSLDEADRAIERAREDQKDQNEGKKAAPDVSTESPKAKTKAPWPTHPDGVVAMANTYLANVGSSASSNGGDRYQVIVHLDQDPLAPDGTVAATLEDGTHVSAETFRRIACDCGLVASTGDGSSIDLGRRTRSISPALRRAPTAVSSLAATTTDSSTPTTSATGCMAAQPTSITSSICAAATTAWSTKTAGTSSATRMANGSSSRRTERSNRPAWPRHGADLHCSDGRRSAISQSPQRPTRTAGTAAHRTTTWRWLGCSGDFRRRSWRSPVPLMSAA